MRANRRQHTELQDRSAERVHWQARVQEKADLVWSDAELEKLARGKQVLLNPREHAALFFALGILHRDATMPPSNHRKFYQINHMVAAIRPALLGLLAQHKNLTFVDAACGSSYLSLATVAYLRAQGAQVSMLCFDRNAKVVEAARERAFFAGLDVETRFVVADALDLLKLDTSTSHPLQTLWADAFGVPIARLSGVLALHACDVASDYALAIGVQNAASCIAVAPCCQAQLATRVKQRMRDNQTAALPLDATFASPHLLREIGAQLTNAMRLGLLVDAGYQATALEFVPTEHSAKNTLLRALVPSLVAQASTVNDAHAYQALALLVGADIELRRWITPRATRQ